MKKNEERKHIFSFEQNVGFNKKYTTIALYALLIIVFGVICVYFLLNNDQYVSVFSMLKGIVFPIFTGMVLAYILNPILKLFEEQVFVSSARRRLNKLRRKLFRVRLTYDHIRLNGEKGKQTLKQADQTLRETHKALGEVRRAVELEEEARRSKRLEKAAKKQKKPSYHQEPSPSASHPYRGLSLLCTYLVFAAVMTLVLWIIIPQCIESVSGLVGKISGLVNTLPKDIDRLISGNELVQSLYGYISEYLNSDLDLRQQLMQMLTEAFSGLSAYLSGMISTLPGYVMSAFSSVTNIILAIFFSVYFLSSKEMLGAQAHKVGKAFLPDKLYKGTCHVINEIDRKFGKFIEGKILDSAIIAVLALIVLWLFKMPYYQMLALIIGITNVIPFFGPIIGGVIGSAIILISSPARLIPFILIVLIIQQLDGNIIGPFILGDSLGLQPIWIMIAIVIMSGLFGFFGMIFGVPLFAVIYTLIREAVGKRLRKVASATEAPPPDAPPSDGGKA